MMIRGWRRVLQENVKEMFAALDSLKPLNVIFFGLILNTKINEMGTIFKAKIFLSLITKKR